MRSLSTLVACLLIGFFTAGCTASYAAQGSRDGQSRGLYEAPAAAVPDSLAAARSALRADAGQQIQPEAPKTAPETAAIESATPRLVIYSAAYNVVVADVAGTLRSLQQAAERLGGYMQQISGSAIAFRVPAAKFQEACGVVEASGEVVGRQVQAQDITEEMRDLGIRQDNAEKLRQRLIDLLQKAEKVEDTLKIEAELARIAEQLDQIKGKIRYLQSQLAMSTIQVQLNSPVAQNSRGTGPRLPFSWVEELGDGLVAGQVRQQTKQLGFFASGPRFKPPAGFVCYYEASDQTEAMDASGLLIQVQYRPNVDKAPLSFWSTLTRKGLVEGRSLLVTDEGSDGVVYMLRGTRDVGGKSIDYLLTLKRSDNRVAVFEAWGPKELMVRSWDEIRKSAVSVDPR